MANFSSGILDVHTTANYPGTPQVDLTVASATQESFRPKFIQVTAEGGTSGSTVQIAFSFDGVITHGVLTVGGNYSTGPMQLSCQKVWLKRVTTVGTEEAQVMAWA